MKNNVGSRMQSNQIKQTISFNTSDLDSMNN